MTENFTFHEEEIVELLSTASKNVARIQLDGRHLLFGEYLQKSPELAEKQATEDGTLTWTEVNMFGFCVCVFFVFFVVFF